MLSVFSLVSRFLSAWLNMFPTVPRIILHSSWSTMTDTTLTLPGHGLIRLLDVLKLNVCACILLNIIMKSVKQVCHLYYFHVFCLWWWEESIPTGPTCATLWGSCKVAIASEPEKGREMVESLFCIWLCNSQLKQKRKAGAKSNSDLIYCKSIIILYIFHYFKKSSRIPTYLKSKLFFKETYCIYKWHSLHSVIVILVKK